MVLCYLCGVVVVLCGCGVQDDGRLLCGVWCAGCDGRLLCGCGGGVFVWCHGGVVMQADCSVYILYKCMVFMHNRYVSVMP